MDTDLDAAQARHRMALRRLDILASGPTRPVSWLAALQELWEASTALRGEHARLARVADGAVRSFRRANPQQPGEHPARP